MKPPDLNPPAKLGVFLMALAALFGVAYLAGAQTRGLVADPSGHETTLATPAGTAEGYSLKVVQPGQDAGADVFVELAVTAPDGRALGGFADGSHPLHVMAFRSDLTGFQHVMPEQGEGTSWWAVLNLTPGPWHVIVDLEPPGHDGTLSLAADFSVAGRYLPQPLPEPAEIVQVRGLDVRRTGSLGTADGSGVSFLVTERGVPVTDLQPDNGVFGPAVLIRPADLGYRHLHAVESSTAGRLDFQGGVPGPGRYRVFLEFYRASQPYVVGFTIDVAR